MKKRLFSLFIIPSLFLVACSPSEPGKTPGTTVKDCIDESDLDRTQDPPELVCDGKEYVLAAPNVFIEKTEITDGNTFSYDRNLFIVDCPETPDETVYRPECGLEHLHPKCDIFEKNFRFILKSDSFDESGVFDVVIERNAPIPEHVDCAKKALGSATSSLASVTPDPNIIFQGKDYIFIEENQVPNHLLSPDAQFLDIFNMKGVDFNVYKELIPKPTGGEKLIFLTESDISSPPAEVEYFEYMELEGPGPGEDPTLQLKAFIPSTPGVWWLKWVGGCKPVIYLYPERETKLDVNVTPKGWITDSIPTLDLEKGWENVLATPEGSIIYEGKEYPYLYYEDMLPQLEVPKEGFVVEKDGLAAFFDDVLPRFGLNKNEIADFKEYWLGRLTQKPYYFVRFLTSKEIEAVENISLSEKPETLIRLRALFIPLDESLDVHAQELPETPAKRSGFTVVEWGGFLEDPNESLISTVSDLINAGMGYVKHLLD